MQFKPRGALTLILHAMAPHLHIGKIDDKLINEQVEQGLKLLEEEPHIAAAFEAACTAIYMAGKEDGKASVSR